MFVTLVSPCISTILLEAVGKAFAASSRLHSKCRALLANRNQKKSVNVAIPLEDRFASTDSAWQATYKDFQRQLEHIEVQHSTLQGTWTLFLGLVRSVRLPTNGRMLRSILPTFRLHGDIHEILAFTLITSFLFSAFVGMIAASIFTAGILTGSLALSNSPDCGIWRPDLNSGIPHGHTLNHDLQEVPLRDTVKATVNYRKTCLNEKSSTTECEVYAALMDRYETESNISCPFNDRQTCLQGPTASYTLETPMIDSAALGINAPTDQRYRFRRKMTCAPISNDDRYIRSNGKLWQYFYGQTEDGQEIHFGSWDGVGVSFPPIEWTAGDFLRGKFKT